MQNVYKIEPTNRFGWDMSNKEFGTRLREKREQAGLQANELAYRCGWSGAQRLSNYENGSRLPNLEVFSELCFQLDKINGDSTAHYVLLNEDVVLDKPISNDSKSIAGAFKRTIEDAIHLDIIRFKPKRNESDLFQIFLEHLRRDTD